jgi:hypothetical protein
MQWCLLAESLNRSIHNKVEEQIDHGYGGIWGGKNASFHHNLLAHHLSRNPRFSGWIQSEYNLNDEERADHRNNVIYNYGSNTAYGGENEGRYNIVANYYKSGPGTANAATRQRILQVSSATAEKQIEGRLPHGIFYIDKNYVDGYPAVTNNNWSSAGVRLDGADIAQCRSLTPFAAAPITQHTAETAYGKVLNYAGASLARDAVDARVVQEARTGTVTYYGSLTNRPGIIDSQGDVGGWPAYASLPAPADSDGDGIPDGWLASHYPGKTASGVNADGYTYLEVYINSLVDDITQQQNADAEGPPTGMSGLREMPVMLHVDARSRTLEISAGDGGIRCVELYGAAGTLLSATPCRTGSCSLPAGQLAPGIYIARILLEDQASPYIIKFVL